jgi:hypothetical protein
VHHKRPPGTSPRHASRSKGNSKVQPVGPSFSRAWPTRGDRANTRWNALLAMLRRVPRHTAICEMPREGPRRAVMPACPPPVPPIPDFDRSPRPAILSPHSRHMDQPEQTKMRLNSGKAGTRTCQNLSPVLRTAGLSGNCRYEATFPLDWSRLNE